METQSVTPIPKFSYTDISLTDYNNSIVIEYVSNEGIPWCQECMRFHDEGDF